MVDTIRTLSELNILLNDNTTAELSPQDIRDLMVSMMVHGEIGSDAKSPITLGTGYEALDFDVAGQFERGLNIDTTNKWIDQIPVTLKAVLYLEVFFKGATTTDYDFTIFKDPAGSPSEILSMRRLDIRTEAATDTAHICYSAGVQLAASDVLQAAVRSNGNNFELLFGVFRVQRIGVE